MDPTLLPLVSALLGAGLVALLVFLLVTQRSLGRAREQIAELRQDLSVQCERAGQAEALRADLAEWRGKHDAEVRGRMEAQSRVAAIEAGHRARLEELERMKKDLEDRFAQLSNAALKTNAESFLQLVSERYGKHDEATRQQLDARQASFNELVGQLHERLGKFDSRIGEIEKARNEAYGAITAQVAQLADGQRNLGQETRRLVQALRAPKTRGRWGEMQLRKVFELAGMTENVDFATEQGMETEAGRLRPDAIVSIPGGKSIVIDAKTPLEAYLDALDAEQQEDQAAHLKRHAAQLRVHVRTLASKAYQDALPAAPDFIVMFIPGETFVAAAAEADPGILEFAFENRVLIASPTTLIALVKAIAYGWQQEKMAENAAEVQRMARDIYGRLCVFVEHLGRVGKSLRSSVDSYNRAVGSLEGRVLPAARRFEEMGVISSEKKIDRLEPVEHEPRAIVVPETTLAAPEVAGQEA
jgi:DNA recombination protein RmuC